MKPVLAALLAFVGLLSLAGCRPLPLVDTGLAVLPTAMPAAQAGTLEPSGPASVSAAPTFDMWCVATGPGTRLYTNPEQGYCLSLPVDMQLVQDDRLPPNMQFFHGPERYPELAPVHVILSVRSQPAAGLSIEQIIDHESARYTATTTVTCTTAILGGAPAFVLDGIPGDGELGLSSRQAYMVFNDRLYRLALWPYASPRATKFQAEAEEVWEAIESSFTFLAPPQAIVTPSPLPTPWIYATERPGLSVYLGASSTYWPDWFQVTFTTEDWRPRDLGLEHRQVPGCTLWPMAGGRGTLRPPIKGQIRLGDYTWETRYFPGEGQIKLMTYAVQAEGTAYLMEWRLPSNASSASRSQCQAAAEAVISSFELVR